MATTPSTKFTNNASAAARRGRLRRRSQRSSSLRGSGSPAGGGELCIAVASPPSDPAARDVFCIISTPNRSQPTALSPPVPANVAPRTCFRRPGSANRVEQHLAVALAQAQHLAPRHLLHLVDAEGAAGGGPVGRVGWCRARGLTWRRHGGWGWIGLSKLDPRDGEGGKGHPLLRPYRRGAAAQRNKRHQRHRPAPALHPVAGPARPGPLAPGGARLPRDRPGKSQHGSSTATNGPSNRTDPAPHALPPSQRPTNGPSPSLRPAHQPSGRRSRPNPQLTPREHRP